MNMLHVTNMKFLLPPLPYLPYSESAYSPPLFSHATIFAFMSTASTDRTALSSDIPRLYNHFSVAYCVITSQLFSVVFDYSPMRILFCRQYRSLPCLLLQYNLYSSFFNKLTSIFTCKNVTFILK